MLVALGKMEAAGLNSQADAPNSECPPGALGLMPCSSLSNCDDTETLAVDLRSLCRRRVVACLVARVSFLEIQSAVADQARETTPTPLSLPFTFVCLQ